MPTPGILDQAVRSQAAVTVDGQTALLAEFASEAHVRSAAAAYHRAFGLNQTSGDEVNGWRAKRELQQDFIEMLATDRDLIVWSGLTAASAAQCRAASNLPTEVVPVRLPLIPELEPLSKFFEPLSIKLTGMVLLLGVYAAWFIRGVRSAGSVKPAPGVSEVNSQELLTRLCAINHLDVPFAVKHGSIPNELIVDWRHADAKWADIARLHSARRTFRIRLLLDEDASVVHATDYTAECDWSTGVQGANFSWRSQRGVIFYQRDAHRVFGIQLNANGKPNLDVSHSWKFNLDEMKAPLIGIVTGAGWEWRASIF
ncbi:MAG: hypothetical protein JNJ83_10375 [Verrucomicrobiaceae bacterium]|nr:hypothetical protein [Verrucomicrobiaceae bacterium]